MFCTYGKPPAYARAHRRLHRRQPPLPAAAASRRQPLARGSTAVNSTPAHMPPTPPLPQVEVDVYRSLGPKRAEPLPGCTSFFQEALQKWRELNSAEHWLGVAAALQPLCQTLAQLVHHRDEVAALLLGALRPEAALSLPPVLELAGVLARDLQADYLPLLQPVLDALADLVDAGVCLCVWGGGGPRGVQQYQRWAGTVALLRRSC